MNAPSSRARTRELALTWLALMALTAVGPTLIGRSWGALLLVLAGLKFSLIAWSFMELRSAHRLWLVVSVVVGVLVLVVAGVLLPE